MVVAIFVIFNPWASTLMRLYVPRVLHIDIAFAMKFCSDSVLAKVPFNFSGFSFTLSLTNYTELSILV